MDVINHKNVQDSELESWLRLGSASGIGPVTASKLLNHFGTAAHIFAASREELVESGASDKLVRELTQCQSPDTDIVVDWLMQSPQHQILTQNSFRFPRLLAECHGAPLILYCKGNIELLNTPQIAIVGTRNPTVSGQKTTVEFTRELVKRGLCITSGLAMGIDGIAHQAALEAGGCTIAVAGTGLDRIYPSRNQKLAHDIAENGLIISEFSLETRVRGSNFPKRNRIISGLSLGVLIVEAALRSGSLITANCALEQGREIFAVPGSIQNPMSKGCHAIIKQGAHLVDSIDDILQQLGWLYEAQQQVEAQNSATPSNNLSAEPLANQDAAISCPDDTELVQILKWIDFSPTSIDQLVDRCKKPVAELSAKLITLELEGWIMNASGGYLRLK